MPFMLLSRGDEREMIATRVVEALQVATVVLERHDQAVGGAGREQESR